MAADPGALRFAQAHVRQPDGRVESRDRRGHGARRLRRALELLDALKADARLADHHRLDAVRAHLLELAGDRDGAVRHYRAAAGKTGNFRSATTFSCRPLDSRASRVHDQGSEIATRSKKQPREGTGGLAERSSAQKRGRRRWRLPWGSSGAAFACLRTDTS